MQDINNIVKKHGSAIFINAGNIKNNYFFIKKLTAPAKVAAVLKSNAYGIGLLEISKILNSIGCQDFFVATSAEALIVRQNTKTANIYVLHGIFENNEEDFVKHNLTPVLNSLQQIQKWQNYAKKIQQKLPAIIHIDTGMNRLGLKEEEITSIVPNLNTLQQDLNIVYIMSHLACSSTANNSFNQEQLTSFNKITNKYFKGIRRSFTSSYGLFFGEEYYFDLVRPGFALYGSNPTPEKTNPLLPVIEFYSTILKINQVKKGEAIGYSHLWHPTKDSLVATVSVGYSDGIFLNHNQDAYLFINNERAPIVGRVSMDSLMLDVTNLKTPAKEGDIVEIIGKNQDIDVFATMNKTINCEALNILSLRYPRIYY